VIDKMTDVVSSRQAVTALRIAMILGSALTSIDADRVHAAVAEAETQTPSLWKLLRTACSKEVRRAAGLGLSLAQIFGASLLERKITGNTAPVTGPR
jgi:spore coat protein CotF